MEALEYWIWEHATKYGMTKVLTQIKCSFTQTNVPNSWLSALFLQQINDDWSKVENKITSKDLNSVRQILVSTYKLFKKQLKHVIKTSDFIQLDFCCKAAFLIMRSSGSEPGMKRRVQNQIFPIWSTSLWTKTKTSFDLKDDLFMDEIKQYYTLIRMQLTHNQENEILVMFGMLMQKHFPMIINLLRNIKQSVLERLQKKDFKLDSSLEFIKPRLSCGLGYELTVLNLLEDIQRRKVLLKAAEFLKEKSILYPASTDTSLDITMYTLPPSSMFQRKDEQIYLPCFATNQHPFMPTNITLEKGGEIQEFMINKSTPLYSDGKSFGAHWFSHSSSYVLKKEMMEPSTNESLDTPDANSTGQEEGLITQDLKEVNVLRASVKRKSYEDREASENSPESKRILVDHNLGGRQILPKVLETLQKQSEELRLIKALDTKHVEAIEICIARVLSSHQKLLLTNHLLESDLAQKLENNL